jgi:hypothetical protein
MDILSSGLAAECSDSGISCSEALLEDAAGEDGLGAKIAYGSLFGIVSFPAEGRLDENEVPAEENGTSRLVGFR